MSEQPKLGEILDQETERDAIHIAIVPVVAEQILRPGQRVGLLYPGDYELVGIGAKKHIGIVDPFLKEQVQPGQRFYLFLLPQSITSLRHNWTHPSFPDAPSGQPDKGAAAESRRWLEDLADEIGWSYDELMTELPSGRIHTGDREMYGCRDTRDIQHHYAMVTGRNIGEVHFSCAC